MDNDSVDVRLIRPDEFAAAPIELPGAFSPANRIAAHYSNCRVALASRGNRIVGAAPLAVAHAGYGRIWPPHIVPNAPRTTLAILVGQAERYFSHEMRGDGTQKLRHIRAFIDRNDLIAAERFESNGFDLQTHIQHLVCINGGSRHARPDGKLSFREVGADDYLAFQEVFRQSCTDSDDCPGLMSQFDEKDVQIRWQHGVRVGRFDTWLIAELGEDEVGCLVLAQGPEDKVAELVYMGLMPRHRGTGLGGELVRWGQWLAFRKSGQDRLTVSVDVSNERALACYLQNDFVRYAETSVFVKAISVC